ncbi:MAG: PAS domain S-box protein, partial [Bacillota bacterium]
MRVKRFYKEIAEKSALGYAYHKVIFDKSKRPVDYVFIEANKAFEKITGISADNIKGKTVRQILPEIVQDEFDWIGFYGKMSLEGGYKRFQRYSQPLGKYYKVIAYSPKKNYFVTIVSEAVDIERELMESRKIYKNTMKELGLILDSISEGVIGIDTNGNCTYFNKSALKILMYDTQEELKGKNAHDLIHYKDLEGNKLLEKDCFLCREFKKGNSVSLTNVVYWKKDGSYFYADVKCNPQYDNGNLIGGVISFFDKTQLKSAEDSLKESERLKSVLLSHLPGMAFRCLNDKDWTMLYVSNGCYDLTGYPSESLIDNRDLSYNDIIDSQYREYIWKKWQKVLKSREEFREEYQIITADNKRKWVLERAQGVYDKNGDIEAIEGLIIDIEELKEKENQIKYLNEHDHMTGVYNRRYFEECKDKLDKAKFMPLSVIMGDINGVKLINDALGHDKGDMVIKTTADILKTVLRPEDILARVGGDEFLYLLPNTDSE